MERDFMGLSSKETLAVVKEEEVTNDGCKESGFSKSSAIQWPFLNKVSSLPHLMSFKVNNDDKTKKIVPEPLVSSGFMPISTADAFDSSQKRSTGEIQKSFNKDRQGGTHFSLTAYPVQHDGHIVHHPHDAKMLPVTNQAISVPMSNPFFKNHFATTGQNFAGANMKQQLFGGIPVTVPHSIVPSVGSVAGITESGVKPAGCPAQLTIFYAGMVNVYEDISPEKAQAIMLLAGNGSSLVSNTSHPKAQVQALDTKLGATDGVPVNQPMRKSPGSGLSSPVSVSSHPGAQSGSGSTSTNELMAAIPQSRKASLARFLEKRKERAMNAAPYNVDKKSPECTN